MKLFVLCCVALLAAIIGCSDAQDTKNALGNGSQPEQSCVPTKVCEDGEEFNCCGPCFQLTCYGNPIDCGGQCYAECYCAQGYVREYPGGRCIPEQFCQRPMLPILSDYDESL
ncbi:uncharacterized protein LOC128298795 [Anopheles moucheti]|uniref:uncharacterized protein LOC128298795 n=1 Tax=Anopheles moucheti TaxID=186751 RepID=UPI0022F07472|nr:uncharacterized protein LOC128298795 [Anopheles moucheti]